MQEITDADVVTTPPKEENDSESWLSKNRRQYVEGEDVQAQDSEQKNIGEVLWLAWGKQLGDHVVGLWDGED